MPPSPLVGLVVEVHDAFNFSRQLLCVGSCSCLIRFYHFCDWFAPGAGLWVSFVLDCHDGTDVGTWVENGDAFYAETQIVFDVYAS